jgi:hypothetical protein
MSTKRRWTATEEDTLKARYPSEGASKGLCQTMNRTKVSLTQHARQLGLSISASNLTTIRREATRVGKHSPMFSGHEDISGHFIAMLRQDARKRDISHPLLDGSASSTKYLWALYLAQERRCALSGNDIEFRSNIYDGTGYTSGSASLDRIDSDKGYIEGNVQWVHKHVNLMKRSLSQEAFIDLAHQIAKKHPRL